MPDERSLSSDDHVSAILAHDPALQQTEWSSDDPHGDVARPCGP